MCNSSSDQPQPETLPLPLGYMLPMHIISRRCSATRLPPRRISNPSAALSNHARLCNMVEFVPFGCPDTKLFVPAFIISGITVMFSNKNTIAHTDPELWAAIQNENRRQEDHIELIASENYASPAVMEAQGSKLTNKYAEGYPGKRYYGGCEYVDVAEQLAIDRAKALFGAEYVNVQPHSGSQANQAVYVSVSYTHLRAH